MSKLRPEDIRFLRGLVSWDGVATVQNLGADQSGGDSRQRCKRWGLVTYDGWYWRITDAGRAALQQVQS